VRYTRDKRGYECTLVMHAYRSANGASRTRVLYLFRSPANLKLGRQALDGEVREALEHTHPDLAFDWQSLQREPAVVGRQDIRERNVKPASRAEPRAEPAGVSRSNVDEAQADAVVEDETMLGRVLGAREAARLRAAHSELLARISRRARTPEDRDRLTERAMRLNPDDWPDEAAVTASVGTVETEWHSISVELPHRRRNRRRRLRQPGLEAPNASGIINDDTDRDDHETDSPQTGAPPAGMAAAIDDDGGGPDRAGDDRFGADARAFERPESTAEAGHDSDSADSADADAGPADPDFPRGD
jgi:hypothetical protein